MLTVNNVIECLSTETNVIIKNSGIGIIFDTLARDIYYSEDYKYVKDEEVIKLKSTSKGIVIDI